MKSISKKRLIEKYLVREKAVNYAQKYGFAESGRKYNYSRQVLHQWAKKYDGTYQSLMPKSRRPYSHPNQHTDEELNMIKAKYGRFKTYGLAHVYAKLRKDGYQRSFCSFKRQLKKHQIQEKIMRKYIKKDRYTKLKATFPGEYVEVDVKYVPKGCIGFKSNVDRYYQITATVYKYILRMNLMYSLKYRFRYGIILMLNSKKKMERERKCIEHIIVMS